MKTKFYKPGFYIFLFYFVYSNLKERPYETKQSCQNNPKLTHIIMPFHINQLKILELNIKNWKKYLPCEKANGYQSPKLIFYVGFHREISMKNLEQTLNGFKESFECFSNADKTQIVTYNFSKGNDLHILGARLMFEYCLNKEHESFKDIQYMFYMEPDCRPIKSKWINALQNEIGSTNFWMKGSFFRGLTKIIYETEYLPNKYHINGNAIYNLGDERFSKFYFQTLRPYIKRHRDSITAFDTDFSEFIMDKKNLLVVGNIIHNFGFTEVVLNYWRQNYSVVEIVQANKNSYLVHGGEPRDW